MLSSPPCPRTARVVLQKEFVARRLDNALLELGISQRQFCVQSGISRTTACAVLGLSGVEPRIASVAKCFGAVNKLADKTRRTMPDRKTADKIIRVFDLPRINAFLRAVKRHPDFSIAEFLRLAQTENINYYCARTTFDAAADRRNFAMEDNRIQVVVEALVRAQTLDGPTHPWCQRLQEMSRCNL